MINPGLFVTLEGADGSGKTRAVKVLNELLIAKGTVDVSLSRDPGGSFIANQIREILVNENTEIEAILPEVQAMLFYCGRMQKLKYILDELERATIVISDRWIDSTAVYQGIVQKKSKFINELLHVSELNKFKVRPDITIFLDIDYETSLSRVGKRSDINGLDKKHLTYKEEVTDSFKHHFYNLQNTLPSKIFIVDANKSTEEVDVALNTIADEIIRRCGYVDKNSFFNKLK